MSRSALASRSAVLVMHAVFQVPSSSIKGARNFPAAGFVVRGKPASRCPDKVGLQAKTRQKISENATMAVQDAAATEPAEFMCAALRARPRHRVPGASPDCCLFSALSSMLRISTP